MPGTDLTRGLAEVRFWRKDHPVSMIEPEEAKTIAKRIIQHLAEAG